MNSLKLFSIGIALSGAAAAQTFSRSFSLPTPSGDPVGLEHNGNGDLLFTNVGLSNQVGLADAMGTVSLTIDVSANSPIPLGVTTDGTSAVWVTDQSGLEVDRYDAGGNYVSSFTVAGTIGFVEGITYNPSSGHLFVVDGTTPQVAEFDTVGNIVGTFPLNGGSVDGIAFDPADASYWVYDSSTDRLRNYGPNFVQRSSIPGTVANGFGAGEGVAVIGDEIFVVSSATSQIVVFVKPPVVGETQPYGRGCPPPNDFYELFPSSGNDLSGTAFTIVPSTIGFTVSPGGAFDPGFSNNLRSGDDSLFQDRMLGFTATFPGLGTIDRIDIDSNGRIGVGLTRSEPREGVDGFLGETMLAVCWDDFDPSSAGAVYFDTAANSATVTWDQVPQAGARDSNTFQVTLFDDGRIECSYISVNDDSLVGLSSGLDGNDPGPVDLTAAIPFSFTTSGLPLTLSAMTRPVTGQSLDLVTANVPSTAVRGGVILGTAPLAVSNPLLPLGCRVLSNGDLTTLPLNLTGGISTLLIPNMMSLVGVTLYGQSVILDPSLAAVIPALLSNGLQIDVGEI